MNENKTQSNIFFFPVFMESDIENSPAGHFPCENTTINTPEPTGVSTFSSSQPVTHSDTATQLATQLAEETTIFTSKISTSTDFTIESELSTPEKYDTSIKTTIGPTADIFQTNGDTEVSTEEHTTVIPTSSFEKTTLQPAIGNIKSLTTNINEDTPISSTYTTTTAERTVSTTLDSTVSQTTTSTMSAETPTHSVTFVNTVADLQESTSATTTNAITSGVETRASATDSMTWRSSTNSPQTTGLLFTSRTCAPCVCNNFTVTDKTSEQILKEILEIKKNLTVKKSTLSSYTRQKISAPDGRWSSAALGSVGVVIIVSASILVILSDIQYVSKAIKVWKKRLEQYRYYLRYNDFDEPYIYDISYVYNSFRFTFRFFLDHPGITNLEEMTRDFRPTETDFCKSELS